MIAAHLTDYLGSTLGGMAEKPVFDPMLVQQADEPAMAIFRGGQTFPPSVQQ